MFVTWRAPRRPRAPGSRRDPRRPGDDEPSAVPSQSGVPNDTNRHQSTEDGTMRGHLVQQGDRYYAVVYEGIDPATGKERHRWYPAGDDAQGRREGARRSRQASARRRLPSRPSGSRSATTSSSAGCRRRSRSCGRRRTRRTRTTSRSTSTPRIGSIPLQKLQPEDLDTFYAQLLIDGKRNGAGGGLSPKSVRIIHGIIRKALADANRKGTVTRNVADLADPPKVRVGGSRAMTVWSADELRQFLAGIEDSELVRADLPRRQHRHATRRGARPAVAQRRPRHRPARRRPTDPLRRVRAPRSPT